MKLPYQMPAPPADPTNRNAYKTIKRLMDIVGACVLTVVGFPVLLLSALAVRLSLGSPVIFRQVRAGLKGRPFVVFKLRTMTGLSVRGQEAIGDDLRLTGLGRFLRATSIDELPQLVNVLRGEMSLVGPRPLLMDYLPLYSTDQAHRHEVKPGITGLTQVSGRNGLTWEEKFALDSWYVDNSSIVLDLRILVETVRRVFSTKGVTAAYHPTMPRFTGSKSSQGQTDANPRDA